MNFQFKKNISNSSVKGLYLVSALAFSLSACDSNNAPQGHYEGTLLTRVNDQIHQVPASSDIAYDGKGNGTLVIKDPQGGLVSTIAFSQIQPNSTSIEIPAVAPSAVNLKKDRDCFAAQDDSIRYCFDSDKFLLEVEDQSHKVVYTLSGNHFTSPGQFVMETPANFTLPDAIERSMTKSFGSRIEFENVMQARHQAKAAYLNLLPHLNFSDVLTNLQVSITSVLASIGDLVPFLLPNRWLQADQAQLLSRAELDAATLMRASMANQVEGLSYALERDTSIRGFEANLLTLAQEAQKKTHDLETQGQMPVGSTDIMATIVDFMTLNISGMDSIVSADKEAVAQALGFHNPEAVAALDLGQESLPLEKAVALDPDQISGIALSRSFELDQVDYLISAARDQKNALFFNWLDPSGDPTAEIGFGFGEKLAVQSSQINQMLIQREELQQSIAQNSFGAVASYNQTVSTYPLLQQTLDLTNRRLTNILALIAPGTGLSDMDVQATFSDALTAGINLETARAGFRVARAQIDRLLLQGFYIKLWPAGVGSDATKSSGEVIVSNLK